ncbi:hypothetical protein FGADI_9280 [Fusarium gaditjirri]|uniref:Nephrocystin 3-like N-terminal domain-containing protein n=1 Tax=Fusarium gaditjirri TaxID=282569 RepID=A0A8H4WT57_9HYPO|nr:hypothetical protein FGADI_9280 [Fusarium gaditjirri]
MSETPKAYSWVHKIPRGLVKNGVILHNALSEIYGSGNFAYEEVGANIVITAFLEEPKDLLAQLVKKKAIKRFIICIPLFPMSPRTEFDLDVEGDKFTELNVKIRSLVSSSFGGSEKFPAEVQLKYLATLEEIVSLVSITPYCWRDQVGRSLHQCNILADKLVNLLDEGKSAGEENHGWQDECNVQKKEELINLFIEINAEINAIMLDLSNVEIFSWLPRVNSLMKERGFPVTTAKVVQNLLVADPATDRDVIKATKGESVQGTWDWVLQTPEFVRWRTSDDHFLWISGGVGSGKTMLAVYLTEQLQLTLASDEIMLYYFFDARLDVRNDAEWFVRSVIYQLIQLVKECKGRHHYPWGTTRFQVLWDIFIGMLQDLRETQIICVLDALDECESNSLELLLTKLKFDIPGLPIKFAILSHAAPGALEDLMNQYPRVSLDASLQVDALGQYIDSSLMALPWVDQLPTDVHNRVKELLQRRSQASYLLAHLALQSLQQFKSSDMVAHLENLPQRLDDLYEWQLRQIETDQREFVLQVLKWCVLSERPMELTQLVKVLPIQTDGSLTPEDALRSRLKHCGFLINVSRHPRRFIFLDGYCKVKTIIHGEYDAVTIVHQSICDFLTRVSSSERWYSLYEVASKHLELATKCLSSMRSTTLEDIKPDTRNSFGSFQNYAQKCWSYHFERTGEHAAELFKDHPEYFKETPWLNKWFFSLGIAKGSFRWRLCLAAAALGLDHLVKCILEREGSKLRLLRIPMLYSTTMNMLGTTPLHLAAQNGHLSTVRMLLETIPINSMDEEHYTPVFLAGMYGHIKVTELLLHAGAGITSQHPLRRAIWSRDEAMVNLLLGWSPSISTTTLQSATRAPIWVDGEKDSMVALLLPLYARQEAKTAMLPKDTSFTAWPRHLLHRKYRSREHNHFSIVLNAAVYSTTSLETMKKLLEFAGNDMNRERREFCLRVALAHGNRAMVQMLIDDYGYSISEADSAQ